MKKYTLLCLAILFSGCRVGAQPVKVVKLPSGKEVKVLSVGKMSFAEDSPALVLNYQTDLNIQDKEALNKEVDEIWQSFKIDAENGRFVNASIRVNSAPNASGLSSGVGFVFKRSKDGTWSKV